MSWKHVVLLGTAAIVLPFARAKADCAEHPEWAAELPHEVDTPKGNHISYRYDWPNESYVIVVTRGGGDGVTRGPYHLTTGGCFAAKIEWESEEFVVLTAGCGTFCWWGEALPVIQDRKPVSVDRPSAFDAERNLLASYGGTNTIIVTNVSTRREQVVRTPVDCPMSGECFTKLHFEDGRLRYIWQWEAVPDGKYRNVPDQQIDVELDTDVTRSP